MDELRGQTISRKVLETRDIRHPHKGIVASAREPVPTERRDNIVFLGWLEPNAGAADHRYA